MGNRAIIKAPNGHIGVYLHWNGGRDSVSAFLQYCKLKGYRPPETDGYGWARLAHYKLDEMLVAIDEAQPEAERLGDYLRSREMASDRLKVGDVVYVPEIDGKPQKVKVVGFGANRIVNGTNVAGKPIVNRFVDVDGSFETNINNYILDATVRIEQA